MSDITRTTGTRELPPRTIPIADQETLINNFIKSVNEISVRVDFEEKELFPPMKEELFRAELVALISSLDYYLFEILKTGIIQIHNKERAITTGFQNFKLPMRFLISALDNPECLSWLSEAIVELFGISSFQSIRQIKYVITMISQKKYNTIIGQISSELSITKRQIENRLKSIFQRRNQIAHNCDIPHDNTEKQDINYVYLKDTIEFIREFIKCLHKSIII